MFFLSCVFWFIDWLIGWLVWFNFFPLLLLLLFSFSLSLLSESCAAFQVTDFTCFFICCDSFPYFFPWFCPWKISLTFVSFLIQPLLVNDLILLKTKGLFVFIANSNLSISPGAVSPLQFSLSIHTEVWTHTGDTRYFLKAFTCASCLSRRCTICWTELSSCRFTSDLSHFAAPFYPSLSCFLCIKITFYYQCPWPSSTLNQKVWYLNIQTLHLDKKGKKTRKPKIWEMLKYTV